MLCRRDFLLSTTSELRVGNALLWYSKANLFLQQISWEAKMEAEDIERYLAELGTELKNRGINKPVHVLLIGGAYMLSKSLQDVTKILPIVLYCSRKHEFARASKHNTL